PWWLPTIGCSPPPSSSSSFAGTLAFLLLSPCPQRALLGAIDLLFLAASLVLAALCRRGANGASPEKDPLLPSPTPDVPVRATGRHAVALGASAVTSAASVVLLALAIFLLPAAG
uniref:Uncharacterized protein n=3 Tax=Triticum urartu TaxID=4572 RepID=A0A8R7P9I4_TRIUA